MEAFFDKYRKLTPEEKKKRTRVKRKKGWCAQLRNTQRYLGFRDQELSKEDASIKDADPLKAKSELEAFESTSLNQTVPFPFDKNVVFVCVDVEAYERNQKKITEIGIATLDTLDIADIPPKTRGSGWTNQIRCRHFRIVENSHLHNTEFIDGCASRFDFGTSEWISIHEAPQVVAACFRPPYSAPRRYTPHPTDSRDVPRYGSDIQPQDDTGPKRNIVLLGHDTSQDIEYMRRLGYNVHNLSNLIDTVDTSVLFRAYKHEVNPRNLGRVLLDLDIDGWNLHNAGNDAAFTVQAMIGICFEAMFPDNRPTEADILADLDEDASSKVIKRAKEDHQEWEDADKDEPNESMNVRLIPGSPPRDSSQGPGEGLDGGQDSEVPVSASQKRRQRRKRNRKGVNKIEQAREEDGSNSRNNTKKKNKVSSSKPGFLPPHLRGLGPTDVDAQEGGYFPPDLREAGPKKKTSLPLHLRGLADQDTKQPITHFAGQAEEVYLQSEDSLGMTQLAEGCRLYIGNLAYATTEADLKFFFADYSVLSTYVPFNPSAKRPAGYAFVNLSTANEAQRAINNLSGKALLGRKVLVQPARNSEKRGGSRQSSIHPATEPDVMPELSSRLTQRMEMW